MANLLGDWYFWWIGTLRSMFDLRSKAGAKARNIVTLREGSATLSMADTDHQFNDVLSLMAHLSALQSGKGTGRKSFVIRLDQSRAIVRKLTVVALPESRHAGAAVLDMEASTPFHSADVHALPVKAITGPAGSYYALVKRSVLDPIVEALQRARADVAGIEFEDDGRWFLLTPAARMVLIKKRGGILRHISVGALAACAVLAPLTLGHIIYRYDTASTQLELLIEPLNIQAKTVRLELDKRAARLAELEALRTTIEDRKPAIAIWEELARVLPDSSFLTDMTITQDKVSIAGYSQSATAIIVALEGSGIFDEVSFTAPVVKVPGRTDDRFSIDLKIGVK
jgi:general secretion pathway protein L